MCSRVVGVVFVDEPVKVLAEIQILLKEDVETRHRMHSPYKAYRADSCDQLYKDYIQSKKPDPIDPNPPTLVAACIVGNIEAARAHLDAGSTFIEEDAGRFFPLLAAAHSGHVDVVELLIDRGAPIEMPFVDGTTPFLAAATYGHLDCVLFLMKRGANVTAQRQDGGHALFMAAQHGHLVSECESPLLESPVVNSTVRFVW